MDTFEKVILRTGNFTDSSGRSVVITKENLDQIVKFHNSTGEENKAPAVVGHPKDNSPAFGWTERLKRKNDYLIASIKPTSNEFREAVEKKVYPRVSASLFRPDSSGNPNKGKYALRHVGFLGGQSPAVTGLPLADLSEPNDNEIIELSIEEPKQEIFKMTKPNTDPNPVDLSAQEKALNERDAALKKKEEAIKVKEDKIASDFAAQEKADIDAKIKGWVDEGKMPPSMKEKAEKILGHASSSDFSADDAKGIKETFCDFVDELQKAKIFTELAMEDDMPKKMTAKQRAALINKEMRESKCNAMTAEQNLMANKTIDKGEDNE